MTRTNALLVFGLVILIVNLTIEEDDLLTRMATRAQQHETDGEGAVQAPVAEIAAGPVTAPPVAMAPAPVVLAEETEQASPELLPERLAPRVEVLLAE